MKAEKVISSACALIYEQAGESKDHMNMAIPLLNILMDECLVAENSRRQTEMKEAPVITGKDEEIPYCDAICRSVLPYGLAARFYAADGDAYNADLMQTRYENNMFKACMVKEEDIKDVY